MRSCVLIAALAFTGAAARGEPAKTSAAKTAVAKKKRKAAKKPQRSKRDMSRYETPADLQAAPGYRYGLMSTETCLAELGARKIPFSAESATPGVVTPVRLTGALHGVTFRTNQAAAARSTTPWEIADCRLVLALDDFAQVLAAHHVVEVRHYSMYRKPAKGWPADKPGARHNGALAIDAARFIREDGEYLDVEDHWNGKIGAKTCEAGAAPVPVTAKATELRAILCDTFAKHIFNFHLTPNYNRPHHNHFHLEVTAGFKYFMAH